MKKKDIIGIIGSSGDLGSQLTTIVRSKGYDVIPSDIADPNSGSISALLNTCAIVHVCVPLSKITNLQVSNKNTLIILHESVMRTSKDYSDVVLQGKGSVVHMLMNKQKRVVIEKGTKHQKRLTEHVVSLGLNPVLMSINEHDLLMARSQAPLALLHEVLSQDLSQYADEGMLTPSGLILMHTLKNRAITWTPATIESILSNQQLQVLLDEMQSKLSLADRMKKRNI